MPLGGRPHSYQGLEAKMKEKIVCFHPVDLSYKDLIFRPSQKKKNKTKQKNPRPKDTPHAKLL